MRASPCMLRSALRKVSSGIGHRAMSSRLAALLPSQERRHLGVDVRLQEVLADGEDLRFQLRIVLQLPDVRVAHHDADAARARQLARRHLGLRLHVHVEPADAGARRSRASPSADRSRTSLRTPRSPWPCAPPSARAARDAAASLTSSSLREVRHDESVRASPQPRVRLARPCRRSTQRLPRLLGQKLQRQRLDDRAQALPERRPLLLGRPRLGMHVVEVDLVLGRALVGADAVERDHLGRAQSKVTVRKRLSHSRRRARLLMRLSSPRYRLVLVRRRQRRRERLVERTARAAAPGRCTSAAGCLRRCRRARRTPGPRPGSRLQIEQRLGQLVAPVAQRPAAGRRQPRLRVHLRPRTHHQRPHQLRHARRPLALIAPVLRRARAPAARGRPRSPARLVDEAVEHRAVRDPSAARRQADHDLLAHRVRVSRSGPRASRR